MNKLFILFGIFLILFGCQNSNKESAKASSNSPQNESLKRSVENNILISNELPKIKIKVDDEFSFIGNFDFEIIASSDEYSEDMLGKPIAEGERFVFAVSDSNSAVEKLFIVQFEGFLSHIDLTYNYNFENAGFIGENKYRHNTWFYDAKKSALENPKNEGAKTRDFLEDKGFKLEDHFMMSRFVGLASDDRKNEIIIYYLEMLKRTTDYSLEEYENSISSEESASIERSFVDRSKNSFTIY